MAMPSLLVIDDDKHTLDGLVRILQCDGYPVSAAASGCEALKLLGQKKFDVIITDINMPGMDGLSLIREVKKMKGQMAIVVITASRSVRQEVAVAVNGAGYNYFLSKPVNIEELKSVLKKLHYFI